MGYINKLYTSEEEETKEDIEEKEPVPLMFHEKYYPALAKGVKTSTLLRSLDKRLRKGVIFSLLPLGLRDSNDMLFRITQVNCIRFDEITDEVAYKEGYREKELLKHILRKYDDELRGDTLLYQIEFERIK